MGRLVGVEARPGLLGNVAAVVIADAERAVAADLCQAVDRVVCEGLRLRGHACAGQQVARTVLEVV